MEKFATPPLTADPETTLPPPLLPDAMARCQSFVAQPAHNEPLGFPGALVDDWQARAVAKMAELLDRY
ncbi:MAG: hypothetical protein KIT00_13715, partial [Rhodospirillales bacterium]|nr:hypothetical protein [Rhodospirillales bacterium]